MKKLLFTTMFLLLCAAFALSQTSSTNPSTSSSTSQTGTGTSSTSGQTGSQSGTTTPSTQDPMATSPSSSSSQSSQSGTTSTTPSSGSSSSGMGTGSTSSSSSQDTNTMGSSQSQSASNGKHAKGEKRIQGCLESAGSSGQFTVRHKNKDIAVIPEGSASDFTSNVGHKVRVYGTWEKALGTQTAMNNQGNSSSTLPQSDQPGRAGSTAGAGTGSSASEMGGTTSGSGSNQSSSGMSGSGSSTNGATREFRASRVESVSDTCDAGKNSSKK